MLVNGVSDSLRSRKLDRGELLCSPIITIRSPFCRWMNPMHVIYATQKTYKTPLDFPDFNNMTTGKWKYTFVMTKISHNRIYLTLFLVGNLYLTNAYLWMTQHICNSKCISIIHVGTICYIVKVIFAKFISRLQKIFKRCWQVCSMGTFKRE